MKLRRGFKKEANEYAREFRAELELGPHAPLCPWQLAGHLLIPVFRLSALSSEIRDEVGYLLNDGREFFSAVTLFHGPRRSILHNDRNAKTRQASDLAHELSHAILGHPPTAPFNDVGCRNINKEIEDEAAWLSAALLISEEAAIAIVQSHATIEEASRNYGVSKSLLNMRINVTGARRRVKAR